MGLEQLFDADLRGKMRASVSSANNQFAGRVTINSGSATQVVSTTSVKSDSLILTSMEANARVSSGQGNPVEISSVIDGSNFTFAYADADNLPPRDTTVHFLIFNGS